MAEDRKLYRNDIADLLGIKHTSLSYRDAKLPPRDGQDLDGSHVRPWWWSSTIAAWRGARVGRGARTDLERKKATDAAKP